MWVDRLILLQIFDTKSCTEICADTLLLEEDLALFTSCFLDRLLIFKKEEQTREMGKINVVGSGTEENNKWERGRGFPKEDNYKQNKNVKKVKNSS